LRLIGKAFLPLRTLKNAEINPPIPPLPKGGEGGLFILCELCVLCGEKMLEETEVTSPN
jgi:hypothetical protein